MRVPWRDRHGRFLRFKAAVLVSTFIPGLLWAFWWMHGDLGGRALNEVIHAMGSWAVRFLLISLAVTPFARLVARWQGPIRTLCARMTGDVHRGEDLAQETFVRLYARRALYEPTGKFSTFLWRMALNICFEPPDSRPMDVLPLR